MFRIDCDRMEFDMKKFFQILSLMMTIMVSTIAIVTAENNNGQYIEAEATLHPDGQNINAMLIVVDQLAYRNLAIQVDELHIMSETTIRDAKLESDIIKTRVETAIRGAKIVSKVRNADGSFHVVARLPIFGGSQSLANAVLPENIQIEELPKPKYTNLVIENFEKDYTGLIIDCRGQNISKAIIPSIKSSDGTDIYTYKNVTRQMATEVGMVSYVDEIKEASARVGIKPLIIKAISVSGECDAVISDEDANKILIANQYSKFLNNCTVVFVR